MEEEVEKPEEIEPLRKKPSRWLLTSVLAILILITIGNYVSTAIIFTLIKRHPAWLIALNPTTRNLLLVSHEMSIGLFFGLSIVRRMIPHPLWFLIGRWYGNAGIKWVQKRSPDVGAMVSTLEEYFPRFGWLICIVYPHPLVCTMAGASKMRFATFFGCNLIGILGFVWASYAFGDWLHPVLTPFVNFGSKYWIPLTVVTVGLVAYGLFAGEKSGRSKLEPINQIEAELDGQVMPDKSSKDEPSK